MNESKENNVSAEKAMSENIWGWKWSWISLGIIIVATLFLIFVGPYENADNNNVEMDGKDSLKVIPEIIKE